jgi:hypothetical protein
VFLGDVAGRLIRRDVRTEHDGILQAANAYERREFLFSHDERFRPVYTANGPDGTLYVVDMYRGIIEGYLFVTSYLRKQVLERTLMQPFNGMGRIYRIVRSDHPRRSWSPPDRDNPAAWVERLAHLNGFWRDMAQRLIVESGDRSVAPAVRTMALDHPEELARLHALWTLEGLQAVTRAILIRSLADSSFRVRMAALRLAEPFLSDSDVAMKVTALVDDERIEVRRQLLFSLGEGQGPALEKAMSRVLSRDSMPRLTPGASRWNVTRAHLLRGRCVRKNEPEPQPHPPGTAALWPARSRVRRSGRPRTPPVRIRSMTRFTDLGLNGYAAGGDLP